MKRQILKDIAPPRHGLSTKQWKQISKLFKRSSRVGAKRRIKRRHLLNAIFWICSTGCAWRDLDPRFPNWKTVYHYFRAWTKSFLLSEVYLMLLAEKQKHGEIDHSQWNVDSTSIRAHRCAAGSDGEGDLGRSRGGFGTKIHAITSACGITLAFWLTPGEKHESQVFIPLLNEVSLIDRLTGLKVKPEKLAADKAYSVRYFRRILRQRGIEPVIPKRKTRSKETRGRPVKIDKESYKKRHVVENVIGKVKEFRRVASRYDRHSESYAAMIYVALIKILLRK